jgi:hypothetical protein
MYPHYSFAQKTTWNRYVFALFVRTKKKKLESLCNRIIHPHKKRLAIVKYPLYSSTQKKLESLCNCIIHPHSQTSVTGFLSKYTLSLGRVANWQYTGMRVRYSLCVSVMFYVLASASPLYIRGLRSLFFVHNRIILFFFFLFFNMTTDDIKKHRKQYE